MSAAVPLRYELPARRRRASGTIAASAASEVSAKASSCASKSPPTPATTAATTAATAITPAANANVSNSATPSSAARPSHPTQSAIPYTGPVEWRRHEAVDVHDHVSVRGAWCSGFGGTRRTGQRGNAECGGRGQRGGNAAARREKAGVLGAHDSSPISSVPDVAG